MKNPKYTKLFSTFLALLLVLSMLTPFSASANTDPAGAAEMSETANQTTVAAKPFKENLADESIMQQKAAIAEQLNLLGGEAKLHDELQNVTGNQQVPVIIHLSEKSVGLEKGIQKMNGKALTHSQAQQVKQKVRNQQSMVKKEMAIKGIQFNEGFSYDTVLNGISGTVKADDLPKLLEVTGVTLVEPDTIVNASETLNKPGKSDGQVDIAMDTSIDFLGIEALWAEGYEGQGIKVAVLDTGIDADHPDFQGIYKGGKNFVPHTGNDYTRPRADDDASETSPVERPSHRPEFNAGGSSFYTSHGTHVAGTIAAIGNNEYGIKGIAPKVDLYAYRVLGAYGSGSTSGIIAAIDYAVQQEMDVINLSLGGGSNTETDASSFAINNAMLAGTISVVATGNSGPNRGTMGTPSTARLGIAVGNTTNPEARYFGDVNINAGNYNLSKTLNLMGTTYGANLADQLNGEYSIVAVPGLGEAADYAGLDVNGKVALVSRGGIPFVDKIAAAKDKGAVAIIVHNFAGGTGAPGPSGTFLGDSFEFIPTFDMSQTDGEAIRAALAQAEGTISFGNFNKTMTAGDEVNNSSSRGPSTPNFDIKPDVTAPGTNIMSTIPMYKADFPDATYEHAYSRKTGTSMATPHIAGIAALVKQANPDWDAFDVKVALSNTAKVLDTSKYDVFSQGAGRVQAYQAAHPEILAYALDTANNNGQTVENKKGTVTFGPQSLANNISVTKQILVKNENGSGGTYNARVQVTKAFRDATVTIDKPTFTLSGEQLLNVTLTASAANTKAGDEILGYIHIEGGSTTASLPFAADFGGKAADEIRNMRISETDLSFNGDGVKDEAVLSFTLTGNVRTNFIELWDIMDPEGGVYGDGYIGYLHAGSSLGAGSYTLRIGGQYTPWGETATATIPDGLYTIDFTAQTVSGNPPIISDFVGPVVVKSTAGTIEGAIEGKTATGQIDDAYIAYQEELVWYGLGYNINTKLKASYEVLKNEEVVASGPITLEQDGTFTFDLPELSKKDNSVKVKYEDAAGNKAEAIIYNAGDQVDEEVEYTVNHETLALAVGASEQLTVTETTTKADGTTEEKDVTADATFTSADESIATVENGNVTAIAAGTTEITVTYEDFTATVAVEVTAGEPDSITFAVNKNHVALNIGQTDQLIVTKTTTTADGNQTVEDVTATSTFASSNENVAIVNSGTITAVGAGETVITVTNGDFTATVGVTVTAAQDPGNSYVVTEESIAHFLNDKKASNIILDLTALQDEVDIEINATVLNAIVRSGKGVVINKDGAVYSLHKNVFSNLNGDITISVGRTAASAITNAVSDIYTITFWNGIGQGKQQLPRVSHAINIDMPVNAGSNQVSIKDANTLAEVAKNANVKNGKVNFSTYSGSSFVATPK
ncbi:S8 family serine peptidase [Sporosarcina sp. ACRSL]|uniref:S8 family serine peptidase n=1 Tax=Sporosarcina sp. ACRSL TaxID=2918215 RepID=UPI001EF47ACA|nr:S8 family serine peptidase [Sporosarcina sp. ACRSL]MCG7343941.1 S8 family serine peptidase [Sporosarcina sp. ACRSL]